MENTYALAAQTVAKVRGEIGTRIADMAQNDMLHIGRLGLSWFAAHMAKMSTRRP